MACSGDMPERDPNRPLPGTQFTGFISTKRVVVSYLSEIRPAPRCTQFSCFTGTKSTNTDAGGSDWALDPVSNVISLPFPRHESIVKYKVRNIRT